MAALLQQWVGSSRLRAMKAVSRKARARTGLTAGRLVVALPTVGTWSAISANVSLQTNSVSSPVGDDRLLPLHSSRSVSEDRSRLGAVAQAQPPNVGSDNKLTFSRAVYWTTA